MSFQKIIFSISIFFTLNVSATYFMQNLDRSEKIIPFIELLESNRIGQSNEWVSYKQSFKEEIKLIIENINTSNDKQLVQFLSTEVYLFKVKELLYIDKTIWRYNTFPYRDFFDEVLKINSKYDDLVAGANDPRVIDLVNKQRLEDLVEYCQGKTRECYAVELDFYNKPSVFDVFSRGYFNLFPSLVTYDNGNCGPYGEDKVYIKIHRLVDADFVRSLEKLRHPATGQNVIVLCKKKWFSKPTIEYNQKKHIINYVVDIQSPLDPWDKRARTPNPNLTDWIVNWIQQ